MEKIDRLGWAAGLSFTAYGRQLGVRVNDPDVLDQLPDYLPPGWEQSDEPVVEGLYSLLVGGKSKRKGTRQFNLVYLGAARLARTMDIDEALRHMESHMQLLVAANSTEGLFVHAGVVGWKGKAILLPGRSMAGKTTLVAALIKAGATYYSDEYAIIDKEGQVWPYPRFLSIRDEDGQHKHKCPPEELGGEIGLEPLPVGLVAMTQYQKDARWQARLLSPSRAMLAMLDNTVAARTQPEDALKRLQKVALSAKAIKTKRDEADDVVERLLSHMPEFG